MRIFDVDPKFIFENNNNPQLAQLNQLLATAKEPWEAAQYKWRIQNLQNSISAGKGMPTDATGNLKPVVDARTWMKQNPNLVKSLPKEALPPEMQQPGILDKIGTAYRNIRSHMNEPSELELQKQQNRWDDQAEYQQKKQAEPWLYPRDPEDDEMTRGARPAQRRVKENVDLQESVELNRIKHLSKVLRG